MLYLVSSDTDLDQAQMTTIYQRRWKVEEYHKSLKQNASMGKAPTKTLATQAPPISSSPCWPTPDWRYSSSNEASAIFDLEPVKIHK